jgi:sensor histidine kinase YesM
MNRLFIHNVFFRICSGAIFGVLVYLLILLINNTVEDIDEIFSHQELYACIALCYVSFESMRAVLKWLDRVSPQGNFQKRLIIRVLGTLGVSLSLVALSISAYYRWVIGFSIGSGELTLFLVVFGALGLLYNILYFSHYYLQQENRSLMDEEARLREKVEADFSSFKSEINPDLLYESLENLILTIHHNADEAEEQIDSLAGIYRYSLVNRQQELVSLEDELAAAGTLIHLLNFKHTHGICFTSDVRQTNEVYLIPGSLLVTIDSIVRNTLISTKSPLRMKLSLEEDDDYLVLQHVLNDRLVQHTESMNAFARLQRSYLFFSEKPFVQVKAGHENFIKFPLVRIPQPVNETS